MNGYIVMYNPEKGYGFILNKARKRIFFHVSDCLISADQIQFGRKVNFEIQEYLKGTNQIAEKAVNYQC